MPQKTLVITPGKMAAFYSLHRLESEVFPFTGLFPSPHRSHTFADTDQTSSAAARAQSPPD